jgi:hypothetical protein
MKTQISLDAYQADILKDVLNEELFFLEGLDQEDNGKKINNIKTIIGRLNQVVFEELDGLINGL